MTFFVRCAERPSEARIGRTGLGPPIVRLSKRAPSAVYAYGQITPPLGPRTAAQAPVTPNRDPSENLDIACRRGDRNARVLAQRLHQLIALASVEARSRARGVTGRRLKRGGDGGREAIP
jgi:hypothetical protein